jgi:GNAT superfamily N-acetyltransferase
MTDAAVRQAGEADANELSRMLARAFHDDPVMAWLFPDEARRARGTERFFHAYLRRLLPQEEVYTTPDRAGAALWALPDRWRTSVRELIRQAPLMPMFGRRLPTVLYGLHVIESHHPREPHHYLAVLGTDPERQGEGIGSRLMGPVLEDCDANEVPAFLESSKESNIAFYSRHGFKLTGEVQLPRGPKLWPMWRDPRP